MDFSVTHTDTQTELEDFHQLLSFPEYSFGYIWHPIAEKGWPDTDGGSGPAAEREVPPEPPDLMPRRKLPEDTRGRRHTIMKIGLTMFSAARKGIVDFRQGARRLVQN